MTNDSPTTDSIPTWRSGRARALLLIMTGLGLAADLASKSIAFAKVAGAPVDIQRDAVLAAGPSRLWTLIPTHPPVEVAPHLLDFTLVLNPGAVFGIGAGQRWVFIIFTLVAIAFALFLFARWTRPRDTAAHAGIGLILAGGLGNLYDRLIFGCVRDFIHPLPGVPMPFGWTHPGGGRELWPYVSNVADLLLIIGVAMLVCYTIRAPNKTRH